MFQGQSSLLTFTQPLMYQDLPSQRLPIPLLQQRRVSQKSTAFHMRLKPPVEFFSYNTLITEYHQYIPYIFDCVEMCGRTPAEEKSI